MLSAQEVKPLLLHEDRSIRDAALQYFKGTWSSDVELVPLILKAYRQYGVEGGSLALAWADRFALHDMALGEVLETLASATDANVVWHLNRILADAPPPVQLSHEPAFADTPNLLPETVDKINRRRDFSTWPADRLWTELQRFSERSEVAKYANEIDHSYSNDLIVALGQHDEPNTETIGDLLVREEGWLEIFLIDLVGERRLRETVPALVDKYRIDTDYMLERVTIALGKIGDPEAIHLIRSAFPHESWTFKNFATSVLGDLKHQSSEDTLLALMKSEQDPTIRTMLCVELCTLFSARGLEVVLDEVRSGYDTSVDCLEESVLPVAHVLGIDIPEADKWRAKREERERHRAQRAVELAELGRRYEASRARGVDPFEHVGAETDTAREESTTIRLGARVGRNAPCPCGSGKKFKRCCARKPR